MKNLLIFVLLMCSLGNLWAQNWPENCVNGISTDPNDPIPSNPDPGEAYHKNTFDWMAEYFPMPSTYCTSVAPEGTQSPFFSLLSSLRAINDGVNSDFQPADGWELVSRNLGYLMQPGQMSTPTTVPHTNSFNFPHIMLYNKYRGTLRVMVAMPYSHPLQQVQIKLTIKNDDSDYQPPYSNLNGLFSQNGTTAAAMDKETVIYKIASPTKYPDNCRNFFFADFHMSYDPCICFFESMIEVGFDFLETSTFKATGRSVGVTRDLVSSLNSGYDPANLLVDFWNEPVGSPDSLKVGSYIYAEAQELYDKHMKKEETAGRFDVAGALYFLKTAAKIGSVLATKGATLPLVAAGSGESRFDVPGAEGATTAVVEEAKKYTLDKALKKGGYGFDFLSSQFKENKKAVMPPMAIESEIVLKGLVTKSTSVSTSGLLFGVPGAKGSINLPEEEDINSNPKQPAFTTYNEPLGLFSLLETPEIKRWHEQTITTTSHLLDCDDIINSTYAWKHRSTERVGLQLEEEISYVLNPAAGIDETKTTIEAAIEIYWDSGYENENGPNNLVPQPYGVCTGYLDGPYPPGTTDVQNYRLTSINSIRDVSEWVNIGCLDELNLGKEIDFSRTRMTSQAVSIPQYLKGENVKANIKFLIHYYFDAIGSDGNQVEHYQELTYPLDFDDSGTQSIYTASQTSVVPTDLIIGTPIGSTTYTSNTDIMATGDIFIVGDLLTSNNAQVTIRAAGDIDIVGTDFGIGSNITIEAGSPVYSFGYCGAPQTAMETGTELSTFCNSPNYKAKVSARTGRSSSPEANQEGNFIRNEEPVIAPLSAFPNPTTGQLTLRYELEESAQVNITIFDLMGAPVLPVQQQANVQAGTHEVAVDMSRLAAGMYHVVMQGNGVKQTVKVVKSK